MALLWMDGFEWLTSGTGGATLNALLEERYRPLGALIGNASGADGTVVSALADKQALRFKHASPSNNYIAVDFDTSPTTLFIAFRVFVREDPFFSNTDFVRVTNGTNEHFSLGLSTYHAWQVHRLGSTRITRFNSREFRFRQWMHVEVKLVIDNSVGEYEIRFNGVTVDSGSGLDTLNTSTSPSTRVVLINPSALQDGWSITDFIVQDDSGSTNDTWIGDNVFVHTKFPNADTSDEQWSLSTGSDSFDLLNDVDNDPATYIESSTTTEKTLCDYEASGSETNIKGVMLSTSAMLDAHGATETFKAIIKEGTTEGDGATNTVEVDNQTEYILDLSAATGGTFTVTVNGNTTAAQAYNVAAATLDSAIQGLTGITAVTVSLTSGVYTIRITNPEADDHTLTVDGSSLTAANSEVLTTRPRQYRDIFELNPDTSAAWTASELDAAQAGVEYV